MDLGIEVVSFGRPKKEGSIMEISSSNNTAVAAFQANVSATSGSQEPRALQETSSAGQQSSSDQVSISSEARSLFESEQGGSQANSGRSSDY